MPARRWKEFDSMCIRLDTIPEVIDRWMDGFYKTMLHCAKCACVCMLMHDKKYNRITMFKILHC